ncbi:MAG: radical SAM protein [Oscillospiraceae bacterium]|nr:radical SAM protein [Oscillospiraceae bacterium]
MKHTANIPIFVPHAGCPNTCIFCDQRTISGSVKLPVPSEVTAFCQNTLDSLDDGIQKAEIAFFGGSFTAIDREYMVALLEAVQSCRQHPKMSGIRLSTRPDAIDGEVLQLLKQYGVTAVELGVQSLDDHVLEKNLRGHSANDTFAASALIKEAELELGHQIMLGMHGDSAEGFRSTVRRSAAMRPDTVRIYPVVVLKNTALQNLWQQGIYQPPTLEEAVELGAWALRQYETAGVKVIRMGLHASAETEQNCVAGVYHPAFRELCESRVLLDAALEQLSECKAGEYTLKVAKGATSKMVGQHRVNILALEKAGYRVMVREDDSVDYMKVIIE